jgi:hypothetical protein
MLSQEHIAFYSTAATVIPVIGVGAVLGAATLARTASARLDKLGETVHSGFASLVKKELAPFLTTRKGRAFIDIELALLRFALLQAGRSFVAPVLFVAVLLPIGGEISALAALSSGHASPGTTTFVWLGLGMSSVIALAPALQTVIFFSAPFSVISSALRVLAAARTTQVSTVPAPPAVPPGDAAGAVQQDSGECT